MSKRDKLIHVRVTAREKEEIEGYIEESGEFAGVSGFLRTAAFREMAEDSAEGVNADEIASVIESSTKGLALDLEQLKQDVLTIKDAVSNTDGVHELSAELYDSLPILEDDSEFESPPGTDVARPGEGDIDIVAERGHANTLQEARAWSDARAWSEYLDESTERTQRALSLCVTQYPDVDVVDYVSPASPKADKEDEIIRRYFRRAF